MGVLAGHLKELATLVGAVRAEGTAEAGTTTTLVDTMRVEGDSTWNDHLLYIYAGTAVGQERPITAFTASSDTITFAPAGTVPGADSKYIILDKPWTMDLLRSALIQSLRLRKRYLFIPKSDESLTINMDPTATYEYNVPAGFVAIQKIIREDAVGAGNFFTIIPNSMWYVEKTATRQIVFNKIHNDRDGFLAHGCKLRLIGQAYETEPTLDTATLSVSMGSLLILAGSLAHRMLAPHDIQNSEKRLALAADMRSEFSRIRFDDASRIYPDSVMVEDL